jgi:hypothetical protein
MRPVPQEFSDFGGTVAPVEPASVKKEFDSKPKAIGVGEPPIDKAHDERISRDWSSLNQEETERLELPWRCVGMVAKGRGKLRDGPESPENEYQNQPTVVLG